MIKYTVLILGSLCIFNIAVHANPLTERNIAASHGEETGLGIGAIIGGLIAGPPGAIVGAAGGAWYGRPAQQEAAQLSSLEKRLVEKQAELAGLEAEFQQLQGTFGRELQQVTMERRRDALKALSEGVSMSVYFRTDSAEIESGLRPRLKKLAAFLQGFPAIQVHLDAHADRRGRESYNRQLSEKRARRIWRELTAAGLDGARIHSHAYGESRAKSAVGDREGQVFDRRVTIQLTLDTGA